MPPQKAVITHRPTTVLLQSALFCPLRDEQLSAFLFENKRQMMAGLEGFEPPTHGLGKQNTGEPRFFRPLPGVIWSKKWESVVANSGLPTICTEPLGSTPAVSPLPVNSTAFVEFPRSPVYGQVDFFWVPRPGSSLLRRPLVADNDSVATARMPKNEPWIHEFPRCVQLCLRCP
jgi:hypothetical protein